jgi:hypothetical protein
MEFPFTTVLQNVLTFIPSTNDQNLVNLFLCSSPNYACNSIIFYVNFSTYPSAVKGHCVEFNTDIIYSPLQSFVIIARKSLDFNIKIKCKFPLTHTYKHTR